MQLQPSHQAEDIGARFAVPSSLRLEIIATGVPKYKIVGSIVLCMSTTVSQHAVASYPILAVEFLFFGSRIPIEECISIEWVSSVGFVMDTGRVHYADRTFIIVKVVG